MKEAASRAIRILLVEDNPGDVRMIRDDLEEARIHVRLDVVEDGEAALDWLARRGRHTAAERPDLVLLDIRLPRKSGLEVLAEMKKDADLSRIPVFILTTSFDEKDIVSSFSMQADGYLNKPLDVTQLVNNIKNIDGFRLSFVRIVAEEEDPAGGAPRHAAGE